MVVGANEEAVYRRRCRRSRRGYAEERRGVRVEQEEGEEERGGENGYADIIYIFVDRMVG